MSDASPRRARRLEAPPRLAEVIQSWVHRLGYEVHAYPGVEDQRRAKLLRSRSITLVLDVGANAGQYAERLRTSGYTGRIISFEPLSGPFTELERCARADERWEVHRLALGADDGQAEINVAANTQSSSLLPMLGRHVQSAPESAYVGSETVPTARLASLWPELGLDHERIWLKLDVQGYELEVLKGAEAILDQIEAVQAELQLVPLYHGDASWRDVADWLGERGLRLAGLEPGFDDPVTGELLQADGIFVRATTT